MWRSRQKVSRKMSAVGEEDRPEKERRKTRLKTDSIGFPVNQTAHIFMTFFFDSKQHIKL